MKLQIMFQYKLRSPGLTQLVSSGVFDIKSPPLFTIGVNNYVNNYVGEV